MSVSPITETELWALIPVDSNFSGESAPLLGLLNSRNTCNVLSTHAPAGGQCLEHYDTATNSPQVILDFRHFGNAMGHRMFFTCNKNV